MASPNSGATETTSTFDEALEAGGSTEFVTNRRSMGLSPRSSIVRSVNTPCVTAAYTAVAPKS